MKGKTPDELETITRCLKLGETLKVPANAVSFRIIKQLKHGKFKVAFDVPADDETLTNRIETTIL